MSIHLLPCPFCGNAEAPTIRQDAAPWRNGGFMIICDASPGGSAGCGAASGWANNEEAVARLWNLRDWGPSAFALLAERDVLKEALERLTWDTEREAGDQCLTKVAPIWVRAYAKETLDAAEVHEASMPSQMDRMPSREATGGLGGLNLPPEPKVSGSQ